MKTTYPIDSLCSDFIMLFHELSYANSIAFTKEFCFNRTEIIKLFELEAQLIKLSNTNIMVGNTKKKDDTNYFILIIKITGIYAYRMAS